MAKEPKPKYDLRLEGKIPHTDKPMNDLDIEDGGQAMIATIGTETGEVFVRIISWDETKKHKDMKHLLGRKVRIIIETID